MQSEALYDSINLVRNSPLSHLWSLSVEEQFYVVAPIMLYLARGKKKMLICLLSMLTLCSLTYYLLNFVEFPSASNYFTSVGRFWELGLGAMAEYFLYKKSTITIPRWLTELGIVLLLLITIRSYEGTLSLHLATLVVALLTTLLIISMESRVLKSKILIFFGERSYSTYLYHLPIAYLILQYNDNIIGKSLTIGLTILLSSLSFKYVERKILKTRASKNKVLFYVLIIAVSLVSLTNLIYKIGPSAPLASNDVKMVQSGERLNNFCDDVNVSCSLDNLKSKLDANASYWLSVLIEEILISFKLASA